MTFFEPPDAASDSAPLPRRCRRCYYVLEHLGQQGRCPECGAPFDLDHPSTYTIKPPFVWWTFWLPGLVTALVVGIVGMALMIALFGYGWSTVMVVPGVVGALLGYRQRTRFAVTAVLGGTAGVGMVLGLFTLNIVGVFCGGVLGLVAFLPALVGALVGAAVRTHLKGTTFTQRWYLPILLALPLLSGLIEGRHSNMAVMATRTTMVIDAPPGVVWNSVQFYEEVKHRPPWLLRLTPSFRPRYTTGRSERVGDIKVCVYERGRLVKQVTDVVPGKRLAFRVIEQTDIENNSVRLIDGSFELSPTEDGRGTRVTLTTRYQPLLGARLAFEPAEALAVHTLHGHVLLGMKLDALSHLTRPSHDDPDHP